MKIEDLGFITSIRKFEENSLLIKILSKENGLISGYIMHIKKDRFNYQIGNLIKFIWTAKNTNQLGNLKIEIIKSYLSSFISNRFYLHLIEYINTLINNLLYERYLENNLYYRIELIFNLVVKNESKLIILKEYLIFENTLLNVIGTGIIFDNQNKIEDLYYISPKTGLAVSKEKGEPCKEKLLLFPILFKKDILEKADILDCFDLLNFFLKKYINENNQDQKYKNIIAAKQNLINIIIISD